MDKIGIKLPDSVQPVNQPDTVKLCGLYLSLDETSKTQDVKIRPIYQTPTCHPHNGLKECRVYRPMSSWSIGPLVKVSCLRAIRLQWGWFGHWKECA
jgi:hypothetical protein